MQAFRMLWIAFKIVIFEIREQLLQLQCLTVRGCESLSKLLSLRYANNAANPSAILTAVVNRFQNCYLWDTRTTSIHLSSLLPSCESLSKLLSLRYANNKIATGRSRPRVVNRFQNCYLWDTRTTHRAREEVPVLLWIAFKIVIFEIREQLGGEIKRSLLGCESLSKLLSLRYANN